MLKNKYTPIVVAGAISVYLIVMAIHWYKYGFSGKVEMDMFYLSELLLSLSILIVSSWVHEFGHYYRIKHYFPEITTDEIFYTKLFGIKIPTAVRNRKAGLLTPFQQITVSLPGIIAGLIPILPLYFINYGSFQILIILYLAIGCVFDFLTILLCILSAVFSGASKHIET